MCVELYSTPPPPMMNFFTKTCFLQFDVEIWLNNYFNVEMVLSFIVILYNFQFYEKNLQLSVFKISL